jgi:hypothetical protein
VVDIVEQRIRFGTIKVSIAAITVSLFIGDFLRRDFSPELKWRPDRLIIFKGRRDVLTGPINPRPGDGIASGGNPTRNLFPVGRKEVTLTLAETVIISLMIVQIAIGLSTRKQIIAGRTCIRRLSAPQTG